MSLIILMCRNLVLFRLVEFFFFFFPSYILRTVELHLEHSHPSHGRITFGTLRGNERFSTFQLEGKCLTKCVVLRRLNKFFLPIYINVLFLNYYLLLPPSQIC